MKEKIESINIIGSGNMAFALYEQLKGKVSVASIFSRSEISWSVLSETKIVNQIYELNMNVDMNIICVSDNAISIISKLLPASIPAVHTSGAMVIDLLSSQNFRGVLYPFQTLSKNRKIDFKDVPVFIEANTVKFEMVLRKFCAENLSDNSITLDSKKRERIHLAGVFANNFTTLLIGSAQEILKENNLSIELLKPLLVETISKVSDIGYEGSQTGPARRGDKLTMEKHLALLNKKEHIELYRLLSEIIESKFKT